ncbi:MAG: protein-glutamate O-methyltransferase CheR, partial [Treponema sp.]|nr:protein-glutamate O-methyltransferase CheR [Treponema sp.]
MADLLTDTDFELFRKVIYDESGITFSATNRSILDSRLKERLREKQLTDVRVYYNLILSDKEEMKLLLDSVTTNLTRFFRNQPHFDAFINHVIPKVIEEKKAKGDRTIKIWSAGCSTGEEPYTIAMILKEILPPGFNFKIIASDLS